MSGHGETLGSAHRVPLDRSGRRWALLREPTGLDEQGVGASTTSDAVRLLDRLLVDEAGAAVRPGDAALLALPERDLLLAAAWRMAWGAQIVGTITCTKCGSLFDFDFDLDELTDQVRSAPGDLTLEDGVYALPSGVRFRLPTARDEASVVGLNGPNAAQALLETCLLSGDLAADGPEVEAAMEQVGSGIDVDFDAACPECGLVAAVRFQIQDYLLGAIASDWTGLVDDVHRIALAYGWSLREILSLTRSRRRALVTLLDGDPLPMSVDAQ